PTAKKPRRRIEGSSVPRANLQYNVASLSPFRRKPGGDKELSEIRAIFEPGIWQDFSKEHRALREEVQSSLDEYRNGKFRDPVAVWGAFGAGKTQFLFWVAEESISRGLIPVYFHLNDVLDGLDSKCPPEGFRDRVHTFVERVIDTLWRDPNSEFLIAI